MFTFASQNFKGSPLSLLFYRQAFGADLIGDLSKIDEVSFDLLVLYQILWAMGKTAQFGAAEPFPDFETWLAGLDSGFDVKSKPFMEAFMGEVAHGFLGQAAAEHAKAFEILTGAN